MCDKCKPTSLIADNTYTCYKCGYEGPTDIKNPGHCAICRHDMRDETEIIPPQQLHG